MMVSYNMKAQYKVELHTEWNHEWEYCPPNGVGEQEHKKGIPRKRKWRFGVFLSDCLPLPIMFYILFIVCNLCNLILSIEGYSFDLPAVAVVRNLHLQHQDHPVHLELILCRMDEW